MVSEIAVRARDGKELIGVARVKLTAVENFGIEGGVRIYAKSCFIMIPVSSIQLAKRFSMWDPGYVTLLLENNKTKPSPFSPDNPVVSLLSSSPENRENRPLFPKSISRTGYFGDPGMRYIPCDNNLSQYLEAVFNEGLKIEFLADCNIGFCPENDSELATPASIDWDIYSYNSPPHDINIERIRESSDKYQISGLERGEVSVCLVGGTHGSENEVCTTQIISYLRMLGSRWIELYA
ncbi:hypothetical protein HDU79_001495 [Rhizoclosmatium sp. JEL0117]|nr:hypothetical protein HDU79_001495 [Rhizoclosmatium sp. JEL0117]